MLHITVFEEATVCVDICGVNDVFPIIWWVPPMRRVWVGLFSMLELNSRSGWRFVWHGENKN